VLVAKAKIIATIKAVFLFIKSLSDKKTKITESDAIREADSFSMMATICTNPG
jgi:hypothetical protein